VIELSRVISDLRRELWDAISAGADEELRFELGPVELEVIVALEQEGGGGGRVRFLVVELGGEGKATHSSTQRVKLTLDPRLVATGERPWVSDKEVHGER